MMMAFSSETCNRRIRGSSNDKTNNAIHGMSKNRFPITNKATLACAGITAAASIGSSLAQDKISASFLADATTTAPFELQLPACASQIDFVIAGSRGGTPNPIGPPFTPGAPGKGATVQENGLFVGLGAKLCVFAGAYRTDALFLRSFNGGGATGTFGASGGGSTDIRVCADCSASACDLSTRVAVAGGGGGGGFSFSNFVVPCDGGDAGYPVGGDAVICEVEPNGGGGTGATQIAGGKGFVGTAASEDGLLGLGGNANQILGGGGGGGLFGGGGGSTHGGGGGSSWSSGTNAVFGMGDNNGFGYANISYTDCTPTQDPTAMPTTSAPTASPTAEPSVSPTLHPTAAPTELTADNFAGCVKDLAGQCYISVLSTDPNVQFQTCFDGGATTEVSRSTVSPPASTSLGSIAVRDYVGNASFAQPPQSSVSCAATGEPSQFKLSFQCFVGLPFHVGLTSAVGECNYETLVLGEEFCSCDEAVPCEGISDWSFLEGKCFNTPGTDLGTDGGQYQYELCFDTGAGVTQDRIDGKPFVTSAGTLTHKDYLGDCQFPHYNGNPCPILNGGSRSGLVTFACNPSETVVSTVEESKCHYKTAIASPDFCGQSAAENAFRN